MAAPSNHVSPWQIGQADSRLLMAHVNADTIPDRHWLGKYDGLGAVAKLQLFDGISREVYTAIGFRPDFPGLDKSTGVCKKEELWLQLRFIPHALDSTLT